MISCRCIQYFVVVRGYVSLEAVPARKSPKSFPQELTKAASSHVVQPMFLAHFLLNTRTISVRAIGLSVVRVEHRCETIFDVLFYDVSTRSTSRTIMLFSPVSAYFSRTD